MKQWISSAVLCACATVAIAADESKTTTQPEATPAPGQMIFVDPNTGEIRQPTAEEWSQLPRPISPKAQISPQQILPDGSIYIPAEAVMQRMTATLDENGKVHVDCDHAEPAK